MTKELLQQALERMDRARAILTNDNPRPECNWGMLDTSDLRAAVAQPTAPDLKALIQKVHSANGRHHSQIAMCDLYDACGLSNVRPTK